MDLKHAEGYVELDEIDFFLIGTPEVIEELKRAASAYHAEMFRAGYSPLTMGSYASSVGRFITFLQDRRLIQDKEQ